MLVQFTASITNYLRIKCKTVGSKLLGLYLYWDISLKILNTMNGCACNNYIPFTYAKLKKLVREEGEFALYL